MNAKACATRSEIFACKDNMSSAISCVESILQTRPSDSASMFFVDVVKRYAVVELDELMYHYGWLSYLDDDLSERSMATWVFPSSIQQHLNVFRGGLWT